MSIFAGLSEKFYSRIADHLISKKFSLKNPGPLQKWVRDLIGDDETHVTQPYRQSIWVYRCLQQWQAVAQVPVMFKDSDGNDIDSGPLKYLIDHPHPKQTTEDLLKWIILSLGLHGEFFLLREDGTNFDGIPLYLSIVWPSRMTISQGDLSRNDGSVMAWTLNLGGGNTRKIDPRGVIHSAAPNPYDCNRGMSPVMAAMASIESDNSARQHNKYQMDRHGRVTGMVTFKDAQGVDNLKLLQKMWAERYEGAENAGRTAFMDGGADFKQLSMAAKDMDWAEGLSITREEICAAYGISTIVAGGLKGATFSNYEMAMKAAWNDTLIPMGRSIAAALNNALIRPIEPDQYIEFDFQNAVAVLQEDENKKIDRYIKLLAGKMTPKQAATLAQIDLGEPNEAHDIIWVSTAEMPASAMLAVPELPADAPKDAQPIQEPPPAPKQFQISANMPEDRKALWDAAFKLVHPDMLTHICDHDNLPGKPNEKAQHIHVKQPSEFLQATGRSILKSLFPYERKLDLQLKRFFYDQRKAVLANAHKAIAQVQGKSVSEGVDGFIVSKAKAGDSFANALLGNTDWNAELIKRVKPTLLEVAKLGGKQILKNLGAANRFELVSMDAFMKQQTILLEEVNEYTREALIAGANDILEGITEGDSLDDTIDKMQDSFKGIFNKTEARRRTIARTETMRAMNGGRMAQMKDIGVEKKQWLAIMDGNVRESHADLNETIIPLGDSWKTVDGNSLEYPGDPKSDVSETANCRCVLIPAFEGNEE